MGFNEGVMSGRAAVGPSMGLALAIALLGAACSSGGGGPKAGEVIVIDGRTIESHGTTDISGQTAEDLRVENFYFEPTVLSGSGGQTIALTIQNDTDTLHNFSVAEQQVSQDVPQGQSVKVTVSLPASGVLVFFCKYHRASGMVGELKAG
jgi:plastocyanin